MLEFFWNFLVRLRVVTLVGGSVVALISQAEAMAILASHSDGLYRMATAPWDEYHARIPQDLLIDFCSRTRASMIHDLIVREATKYSLKTDGVRPFERQLMKGIVIDDRIAIRFKKLDEESGSRGHYTKQVEEFRSQQQLDGIDAPHHLELGYVLNGDETEVAEVRIVCPAGRDNAWWARIEDRGIKPVVIDLLPNDMLPMPDSGAIIKPKDTGVVVPIRRNTDER